MTNHFDEFDERDVSEPVDPEMKATGCPDSEHYPVSCFSAMQRDRFELLSAYLDGEVTAVERRQVEQWLAEDVLTQRLYSRLLSLRQGLQTLPIDRASQSVDQLVEHVTARLERQPRRLVWGGLAIAAVFVGAIFTSMPRENYAPSIADSFVPSEDVPSDGLMIALNQPPIEIPKAANSIPTDALHKSNQDIR